MADEDTSEAQELQRRQQQGVIRMGADAVARTAATFRGDAGAMAEGPAETIALTEASMEAKAKQQEQLERMELRRRMREMVVPTADAEVRSLLRQMEEPVTLFGEREMERRERLRRLLATSEAAQDKLAASAAAAALVVEEVVPSRELFYTEGGEELRGARMQIARFSLLAAAERVALQKSRRANPLDDEAEEMGAAARAMATVVQQSSEIGDERPVSGCAFSPDGSCLATCSWSGMVKLWGMPNCALARSMRAHDDRATDVAWHPHANMEPGTLALATGGVDGSAKLLSADGQVLQALAGHTDRLARIAFHPMGGHLATASFDRTWRLWDLATGACLLEQEGHSRPVYAVAAQCDGSLVASGGLDAVGRVWDMRSGRCVITLQGHVKGILAADWSPNGYVLATGSDDHTARVWDLRQRGCIYTLPGHTSLLSQVRFEPGSGSYLLTSGYDNASKLWGARDFRLLRTLAGHEGKVMASDIAPGGSGLLASVSYDRTIKLWGPDELALEAGAGGDVDMGEP